MKHIKKVAFICFGEINTPYERLQRKHDDALAALSALDMEIIDAGIVIDDPEYKTADAAIERLRGGNFSSVIVCLAGWVPTHAVIRVTDHFRHLPLLLWGLCGWMENGHIVTTAEQAGTSALRPALEELGYTFKFVYDIIGEKEPIESIWAFVRAADAAKRLRSARVGTMGYRDMLLYGTQYEGNSMRGRIGVEVEPYEMLEMVQTVDALDAQKIAEGVKYVRDNWKIMGQCDEAILEKGVKYALAIGKKIRERGWEAVTLIDVDGMKKLCGFPPAIVFMLLERWYGVLTTPENDVMGNVTELMLHYLADDISWYMEYYEYFKDSMLIGTPDYVPVPVIDGEVKLLPAAFGLLNTSLLNVSRVRTGYVTCARLVYRRSGRYAMHFYTAKAEEAPAWNEYGWADPAPQLCSLRVYPDSCTVHEFAQNVCSQHVILCYGDQTEALIDLCKILDIDVIH